MKKILNGLASLAGLLVLAACALGATPAAAQYNTKNYMAQGGATWHVGGALTTDVGGVITADKGSATANAGNSYAVTVNAMSGIITTDSLSTAAAGSRTITITDSAITASSLVELNWSGGTNTAGTPVFEAVPSASTLTITIYNKHASAAFSGTFILHFLVL